MIARIWRGVVRREDGDAYAAHVLDAGFPAYAATPGNRGAWMLRRDEGDCTEFVTFTLWDSIDNLRGFTGNDDRYLIEHDPAIAYYEVAGRAGHRL